jgi:hypothetical protein
MCEEGQDDEWGERKDWGRERKGKEKKSMQGKWSEEGMWKVGVLQPSEETKEIYRQKDSARNFDRTAKEGKKETKQGYQIWHEVISCK